MKSKSKKIIITILAILALAGAGIGYYMYQKGPLDVKSAKGISVSATELYKIYSVDSVKAGQEFTGRVLEVTGTVIDVSENTQQQQVVLLETGVDGAHVNCTLEEKSAGIARGQLLQIKGLASGIGQGDPDLGIAGDVYLARCYHTK